MLSSYDKHLDFVEAKIQLGREVVGAPFGNFKREFRKLKSQFASRDQIHSGQNSVQIHSGSSNCHLIWIMSYCFFKTSQPLCTAGKTPKHTRL